MSSDGGPPDDDAPPPTGGDEAADPDAPPAGGEDQFSLFASLRARTAALETEVQRRWRKCEPTSSVPLALNDYVRRVAMKWPLAAVGTARGGVVVADLVANKMIAVAHTAHPAAVDKEEVAKAVRLLNGEYDGYGVLAMALRADMVASAGRDGGVKLWKLAAEDKELNQTGSLDTRADAIASAILLPGDEEDGPIWAGFMDGVLRCWSNASAERPSLELACGSPVLAIASCVELGLVAAATASGNVALFSLDGAPRGAWAPFAANGTNSSLGARARSVAFAQEPRTGRWGVIVGGSDGTIHRHLLTAPGSEEEGGSIFSLFDGSRGGELFRPKHDGSVVALAPGPAGLMVSGAHDGTLRVWDLQLEEPKCLYGLGGYKVWLGSVCTDGTRLLSDGADNKVILHDFSAEAKPTPKTE